MKPAAVFLLVILGRLFSTSCLAEISIEGSVSHPKNISAPVANQRYEIVSEAGVLKTDPPRAVVYLEGNFPKPASMPVKEMAQKDMTFLPNLLPIELGTK